MGTAEALHDVKRIAANGQVSVGKASAGKLVRVEPTEGGILLRFVRDVPEGAWWLHEPYKSDLERALAWAAEHPAESSNLDELMAEAKRNRAAPPKPAVRKRAAKSASRTKNDEPRPRSANGARRTPAPAAAKRAGRPAR